MSQPVIRESREYHKQYATMLRWIRYPSAIAAGLAFGPVGFVAMAGFNKLATHLEEQTADRALTSAELLS